MPTRGTVGGGWNAAGVAGMTVRSPAERVLTSRELNRALLARQLLLEPAAAPPAEVAARVCGLQTQHAPSGYIGMWSRAAAFRRADLTAALERAEVVQGWVMRSTIHMVAAPDYLPFTTAVRAARRAQWLRAEKRAAGLDMPAVAAAVRRYLGGRPAQPAPARRSARGGRVPEGRMDGRATVGRPAARATGRNVGQAAGPPVRAGGARREQHPGRLRERPATLRSGRRRRPRAARHPLPAGLRARLPGRRRVVHRLVDHGRARRARPL